MFNSQPNLFGWNINDETSELTFRIFDHPTIWIFKNTQTQSVEQVNISWAENTLNLSGYSTQDSTLLNPGEQVQLRLYWQVLSNLTEGYYKYSRFVEIQDEGGKTLVRTSTDLEDFYIPPCWAISMPLEDNITLNLPLGIEAGRYQIRVGLYYTDTLKSIPIIDEEFGDSVLIQEIEIVN